MPKRESDIGGERVGQSKPASVACQCAGLFETAQFLQRGTAGLCGTEAAAQVVKIESDVRGSAAYKRQLVRVYVTRALNQAIGPEGA